ncbi:caspase family protein [Pararoseomonas sp. SCSIO 73927]|uniref:caspase family protein n=1 Tax=Pararoseomonas sp. SCSIO 73927 TaxID=3114537 RepID=UPI0030D45737
MAMPAAMTRPSVRRRLAGALARRLRGALLLLLLLPGAALAADPPGPAQPRRVALVVGNSAYRSLGALANPANDATLIAGTLRGLGFSLVGGGPQLNLDKAGFDRAVQAFGAALQEADVGLFYYAGHGLQVGGTNWLVPVGANPTGPRDIDFQMVDAELVLKQMQFARTKLNILILDACRNNPFGGRGLRSSGGGLAEMRAPQGTLIAYATQPGNVAQDGAGANSPFSSALATTLVQPGLDVFRLFNQVGLAVKRETAGEQQPWVSSSPIEGEFYFAAAPGAAAPRPAADPDQLFWQSVAESNRPAEYRAYLSQFPQGRYAELARARLAPPEMPQMPGKPEALAALPSFRPGRPAPPSRPPAEAAPSLFMAGVEALNRAGRAGEHGYLSYAREFSPERGPTGRETSVSFRNVFGPTEREALRQLSRALAEGGGGAGSAAFADITEPLALPRAPQGGRPPAAPAEPLPAAAERFVAAANALMAVLDQARPYYENSNFLDDRFARGRAMHPGIITAYRDFLAARLGLTEALRALVPAERETFLNGARPEMRPVQALVQRNLTQGRQLLGFIVAGLDGGRDPRGLDAGRLQAEIDLFERGLNELQARVRDGDGGVSEAAFGTGGAIRIKGYLENAGGFLTVSRYLLRQVRARQAPDSLYFSFRTGYENDVVSRFNNLVGSANLLSGA